MKAGINFIRLATPTTDDKRLPKVLTNTSGFVYYVSLNGVTGAAGPAPADPDKAAQRIRDLGTRGTGEHSQLSAEAALKAGANTIEVLGGAYALDIDYLEVKSL